MGKQVIDLKAQKGMSRAQSNEHLRNFSEEAYRKKKTGNFDPSREHLNFEVTKGGKVIPVNKGYSIPKRIEDNLYARGIKDPNERLIKSGLEPKYRTVASFILGGSTEDMRRLAFGDQVVDYNEKKDHEPDNYQVTRQKAIEDWAVDVYNFMAKKYGEENIVAFVVHLDEKNPHVHCTVLPVAEDNKISWKKVISGEGSKYEGAQRFRELHNEFAEINRKYGLDRGDDKRTSGATHKEYNEYLHEQNNNLYKENAEKKKENDNLDSEINSKKETVKSLDDQIKETRRKVRGLTTMMLNLQTVRDDLSKEIDSLTEKRNSLQGDTSKIDLQIAQLRQQLKTTNDKISMREQQIADAQKQLADLRSQINKSGNELQDMAFRRIEEEKNLKEVEEKKLSNVKNSMRSIGWTTAAIDTERRFSMLTQESEAWTPSQRNFFDNEIKSVFEGSLIDLMAKRSEEIITTASLLFLGMFNPALHSSGGGGGGGSSDLRWDGRNKDEDDNAYAVRCFIASMRMARKSGGHSKKKGVSY